MLRRYIRLAFKVERLPSTVAGLVALAGGVILTLLSLRSRLTVMQSLSAILGLLTFVAFGEVLQRIVTLTALEERVKELQSEFGTYKIQLRPMKELTPFEEFVGDADELLLVGLTKIGIIVQRMNYFSELVRRGCTVRVILLDPDEPNLLGTVANNLEIDEDRLATDLRQTVSTLQSIRSRLSPAANRRLQIRYSPASPGLGMVIARGGKHSARIQLYFYTYQTDPGDRPGVEIEQSSEPLWFDYFRSKYEGMWHDLVTNAATDPAPR
jgi:hypothetical protein